MTQTTPQAQWDAWGAPPPPAPPSPPRKRHTGRIILTAAVVLFIFGGVIASAISEHGTDQTATTAAPATPATQSPAAAAPTPAADAAEPEPAKDNAPTTAKVGDTLQFEDSFGKHSADVTIVRAKVSTGSEFETPDNGRYVGFLIRVKAFQDGITAPDFYALERGHHYDPTFTSGFEPDYNAVYEVNSGETHEGWLVFDVPSRHGALNMKEFLSDNIQASWTF